MLTLINKAELLSKINQLEVLADTFSKLDWERYEEIKLQIRELDLILLDILNAENETFLQNIQKDIA